MPHIRRFTVLLLPLALLLLCLSASPSFAAAFDRTVGARLRLFLSSALGLFPISLTELCLLLFIPLLLLILLAAVKSRRPSRLADRLLRVLLLYSFLFVTVFAPGLYRPPLEDTLGLSKAPPSEEEILLCAAYLSRLAEAPPEEPEGAEIARRILLAYQRLGERYPVLPNLAARPKSARTPLLSRLGYFGLYAFPFGEVTVAHDLHGVRYGFTVAHELAHASGFAREGEADLLAFLACLESGDAYLRFVGASGMLDRLLCELYSSAPELWETVSDGLPPVTRSELAEKGEKGEDTACQADPTPDYGKTVLLLCALLRAREAPCEYTEA